MSLPGYDAWKLASPDDDGCCEYCGATPASARDGWQPNCCTNACGCRWRDPDAERDAMRDERDADRCFDMGDW